MLVSGRQTTAAATTKRQERRWAPGIFVPKKTVLSHPNPDRSDLYKNVEIAIKDQLDLLEAKAAVIKLPGFFGKAIPGDLIFEKNAYKTLFFEITHSDDAIAASVLADFAERNKDHHNISKWVKETLSVLLRKESHNVPEKTAMSFA